MTWNVLLSRMRSMKDRLLFVAIAGCAAAIDLVTKWVIFQRLGMPGERPGIVLVPKILALETNLNEGALFGMGQGMGAFFATVSVAAMIGILALVSRTATRGVRS